jgi:hypothetical protein
MRSVQKILSGLCLALMVSASMPCRAEGLNLRELQAPAALGISPPLKAQMQTTGTPSSGHMSTKKKTWIIVGSVLGAIAIGAAVSSHGGGGSSGGGGGY